MSAQELRIDGRFRGPPHSANGGYACGCAVRGMQAGVGEGLQVSLRAPPPLDHALRIEVDSAGEGDLPSQSMFADAQLIAQAQLTSLDLALPPAPTLEQARTRAEHYTGFESHAYGTCFVCGPERPVGDGLRIFAGRTQPGEPVAAPWEPTPDLGDAQGLVRAEHVWAALDCPGYFAVAEVGELALLARLTCHVAARPDTSDTSIVVGWAIGREGRKLHAGTALFSAEGEALAWSRQLWIKVDKLPGT